MLEHYGQSLAHFLQTHPHWGGLITFLIAFLESLPIVGTIVPGSITMTAIGILIGTGIMPFSLTLLWAILGAFIGDLLGYWVGVYYNERLRKIWPFKRNPHWLTAGEVFFKKHGGKSIIVGRFVGPMRSVIPMIAGILHMRLQNFIFAAVPSAALWSVVYMLPGILLGALSLQLPPGLATKIILFCLSIILILSIFAWLIKYAFYKIKKLTGFTLKRSWNYLLAHPRYDKATCLIACKNNPEDERQLGWLVLGVILSFIFLIIFFEVLKHGQLTVFNVPGHELLRSLRHVSADYIMVALTFLGEGPVLTISGLFILIWFLWKRKYHEALHWVAAILVGLIVPNVLKRLISSPRPTGLLGGPVSSSFPSGHTFFSVVFYGFLAVLIASHLKTPYKKYPYYVATLLIILVGLSRLYLGIHWFTDVLGSMALGGACLSLIALSYRRKITPMKSTSLILVPVTVLIITWSLYFTFAHQRAIYGYTLIWPTKTILETAWWGQSNPAIPIYRISRFGNPVEPFNIQWVGDKDKIKSELLEHGWIKNPRVNKIKNVITNLSQPQNENSLLPALYQNHSPTLFMYKNIGNRKLILRLWNSNVHLADNLPTLFVGNIIEYQNSTAQKISSYNVIGDLLSYLSHFHWRIIEITQEKIPSKIKKKNWDGKVLQIISG